ncbi:DUF5672 family protein [Luminiphilus syltensis]|nr:DUF5672 family protein [Luminiphilus syltensis]
MKPDSLSSASILAQQITLRTGTPREHLGSEHIADLGSTLSKIFPDATECVVSEAFAHLEFDPEPSGEPLWGVIVETREHPALHTVLHNIISHCAIPVQLFHGAENRNFIYSGPIARLIDDGQLTTTELNIRAPIDLRYYNQLMLSRRFWDQILGRGKILIFQTDSMCCPGSSYRIDDFTAYDYIGSRWGRQRPVGLTIDGGSGGFSLRDWSRSVGCLERFPPTHWPAGEDGYFAFHLDLVGHRVASMAQAGRFSTQDTFTERSFGCHQISRLPVSKQQAFLRYCPEALDVFPELRHGELRGMVDSSPSVQESTHQGAFSSDSMFISHRYQLIFFEVPRTGSNSVTQVLNRIDPDSPTLAERKVRGGGWAFHYFTEAAEEFPHYRLVAAHRNPYERLWSFWKHRKHGGNPEIFLSLSWKRYIDWVCEPTSVPEVQAAMQDIPITEMLDVSRVSHWLDFHRLGDSWQTLIEQMGLPPAVLPASNGSPDHGTLHQAFNETLAQRVAERFSQDFDYFGYDRNSWQAGYPLESQR